MSAAPATARVLATAVTSPAAGHAAPKPGAPRPKRDHPSLRAVPTPRTPARAPFVVLVAFLLAGGLVLVLLVNTWLAQGSFEMQQLQRQKVSLDVRAQAVSQHIADESAPHALAARAAAMGLVPAPNPVFKAADGSVLGVANKAVRPAPPPPPVPTPTPSANASAAPGTAASSGSAVSPKPAAQPSASAANAAARPTTSAGQG